MYTDCHCLFASSVLIGQFFIFQEELKKSLQPPTFDRYHLSSTCLFIFNEAEHRNFQHPNRHCIPCNNDYESSEYKRSKTLDLDKLPGRRLAILVFLPPHIYNFQSQEILFFLFIINSSGLLGIIRKTISN